VCRAASKHTVHQLAATRAFVTTAPVCGARELPRSWRIRDVVAADFIPSSSQGHAARGSRRELPSGLSGRRPRAPQYSAGSGKTVRRFAGGQGVSMKPCRRSPARVPRVLNVTKCRMSQPTRAERSPTSRARHDPKRKPRSDRSARRLLSRLVSRAGVRDDIAEEGKAGMARGIDKTKSVLAALAAWRAEVAARIRRDAARQRADSRV
jgi:hypothetical protein